MTFVVFICALILSVWVIDKGIEPTLIDIAEKKQVNLHEKPSMKRSVRELLTTFK